MKKGAPRLIEIVRLVTWLFNVLALYQRSLLLTHRNGFPRFSARSAWRGGAGHREPCGTLPESPGPQDLGKPPPVARANRRGRREALPMTHIASGSPPARPLARQIASAISMGQ